MENDLLVTLLNQYIKNNYPPDELSREINETQNQVIRFIWDSGYCRDFAYTKERYIAAKRLLACYWSNN